LPLRRHYLEDARTSRRSHSAILPAPQSDPHWCIARYALPLPLVSRPPVLPCLTAAPTVLPTDRPPSLYLPVKYYYSLSIAVNLYRLYRRERWRCGGGTSHPVAGE
jgi:hypothetical protein